jgi:phosphomannomutase
LALIKSISGIRGIIGGRAGTHLTPQDIVACTAAYGAWLLRQGAAPKIVLGRDGRISGPMVSGLVSQTLIALGIDVIDIGLSTTPTVEMAVPAAQAGGGIIITASHNPAQWNALKLLNARGEFISEQDGADFLALLTEGGIEYASVESLGQYTRSDQYLDYHIQAILAMADVDVEAIRRCTYRVVVDAVNSTGAIAVPALLEQLGCEVIVINGSVDGHFAHNPEPLPEHLTELAALVVAEGADLGIAVDPDVDRLALVCEDGRFFGEEYTLVAVADYMLSRHKGSTVSNLSSSRALRDITLRHGGTYHAAAVGEVNVVTMMKAVDAVIGGEGNGGVIVPALHYGRDALAGIALLLTHLSRTGLRLSELRRQYPDYYMVKDRIDLHAGIDMDALMSRLHEQFSGEDCTTIDGLKIDFADGWVHLRKSNTEPIIRVYAEAGTQERAQELAGMLKAAAMKD